MAKDRLGENYSRKVVVAKQGNRKGLLVFSNLKKFWAYLEKEFTHYERMQDMGTFYMFYRIDSYSTFMKYFRREDYLQLQVKNAIHPYPLEIKITVGQYEVK